MTQFTVLLFVANYGDYSLSVFQDADGSFAVQTADTYGNVDVAVTDFDDIATTVSECLDEAENCECTVAFCSAIFQRYFEEV